MKGRVVLRAVKVASFAQYVSMSVMHAEWNRCNFLHGIDVAFSGSGRTVFVGTREFAQSVFHYVEAGDPLDECLQPIPSVRDDQALPALDFDRDKPHIGARPT